MKQFRVCMRDGVWHVLSGEAAIIESDGRDELVQLARKVAARHDGEVSVYDKAGKLEVVYAYSGGTESLRGPWPARLRVISGK